jgi:ADP-heptose:LPS heptosyltransferase
MKPPLHVIGMHGLGDCLHQRAVLRQLMQRYSVMLDTSWPSLYHDLCEDGLKLCRRPVSLRTQFKNAQRESDKFSSLRFAPGMRSMRIAYGGAQVLQTPSKTILEVMCNATGTSFADADYRLPIPHAWRAGLFKKLGTLPDKAAERPWLVYRPLVGRREWASSLRRNADPAAYAAVLHEIQTAGDFFTISVADLEAGQEWVVGPDAKADLSFHAGELVFEALAALFEEANLVLTSSGFAAILAPAVGTPCISVVGGYEYPGCHDSAAKFAPYLSIGPETSCSCWTSRCNKICSKTIDLGAALPRVREFVSEACKDQPHAPESDAPASAA